MNLFGYNFSIKPIQDLTGTGSDLSRNQLPKYGNRSLYLNNIINKISTDMGLAAVIHKSVQKTGVDENGEPTTSLRINRHGAIMKTFNVEPNSYQVPMIFWVKVVEEMMYNRYAFVVPKYSESGELSELHILDNYTNMRVDNKFIEYTIGTKYFKLNRSNILIFENPKFVALNTINSVIKLIDENLNLIESQIATATHVNAILELPYKINDKSSALRAKKRIDSIFETATKGGVGYLEKDEKLSTLSKSINSMNTETIDFLKDQLYNAYGLNEDLFNCNYTEAQWQAYYHAVLHPLITVIEQELNLKLLSKTARTQGHKILFKLKDPSLLSLKDYAAAGFQLKYSGILNADEIREIKDYEPYDGGHIYETNANAVQITGMNNSNDDKQNGGE